jgi:hypothetical protein
MTVNKNELGRTMPVVPNLVGGTKWDIIDQDQWLREKIYYSKVDAELTKEMYDWCNENKESLKDAHDFLVGNIEGQLKIPHKDDNNLFRRVEEMIKRNLGTFLRHPLQKIMIENLWINYQKKDEFNSVHSHGGNFSFVWYLDFPEEIHKEVYDISQQEVAPQSIVNGCIEFFSPSGWNNTTLLLPNTNDFLLFTADHRHAVYPFKSDVTRVSISGNIGQFFVEPLNGE